MPIEFDVLHFIKETQLQHGLRADDFARYHNYLSNRVANLRRQLRLANDKKKFLHREVTAANATEPRHLMLLVLYAERCWAEAERCSERNAAAQRQSGDGGGNTAVPGGVPPKEYSRKRLNKAVIWARKLAEVAAATAAPRTSTECQGYLAECEGRCALSHGNFDKAKHAFRRCRELYASLQFGSNENQSPVILMKVGEIDDRVMYCMQCLGEDLASYRPTDVAGATTQFAVTVEWNRRKLNIFSVKVKDALREAQQCGWSSAKSRALEAPGPIPVGTQAKVLELLDRVIGLYSDALVFARQDLRGASDSQRQELQLLAHYLSFHVSLHVLERTRFMIEVFGRRYQATVEALQHQKQPNGSASEDHLATAVSSASASATGKNRVAAATAFPPSQYASPLELTRLYDSALETIGEMTLLPGIAGRDDVESWEEECKAGKLVYSAEAWRVTKEFSAAQAQLQLAAKTVAAIPQKTPSIVALQRRIQEALVTVAAEQVLHAARGGATASPASPPLSTSPSLPSKQPRSKCLADTMGEFAVASSVAKFPPDFQAVSCKPVFVDIASTHIDYPLPAALASEAAVSAHAVEGPKGADKTHEQGSTSQRSQQQQQQQQQQGDQPKKGWGWGWGWGKK